MEKILHRIRSAYVAQCLVNPILQRIPRDAQILEIGGGYRPRFLKAAYPNVHHLDHASQSDLQQKYRQDKSVAHLVTNIQHVDFIADGRPLDQLVPPHLRFEVIFGSHVIEHQVDLIESLRAMAALLRPDGKVYLVIPDLRCTFDALRFPTVISDVLQVHLQGHRVHRLKQIFDHTGRTVNVNPGRNVTERDLKGASFLQSLAAARRALDEAEQTGQAYVDAHAWTFTPDSFRLLMLELQLLALVQLEVEIASPTYGNQFLTVLRRGEPVAVTMVTQQIAERQRFELARSLRLR